MNQAEEAARQTIGRLRPEIARSVPTAVSDTSLDPKPVRWQAEGEWSESDEQTSPANPSVTEDSANDYPPDIAPSSFNGENAEVK